LIINSSTVEAGTARAAISEEHPLGGIEPVAFGCFKVAVELALTAFYTFRSI
jgi:hypothetical protein